MKAYVVTEYCGTSNVCVALTLEAAEEALKEREAIIKSCLPKKMSVGEDGHIYLDIWDSCYRFYDIEELDIYG